jgi:hypothetical protein
MKTNKKLSIYFFLVNNDGVIELPDSEYGLFFGGKIQNHKLQKRKRDRINKKRRVIVERTIITDGYGGLFQSNIHVQSNQEHDNQSQPIRNAEISCRLKYSFNHLFIS